MVVVAVAVVVATKSQLSRSSRGRSHQVAVEPQPCFVTKSVKFRFGELSFGASGSKSRDLQSGHGFRPCFCTSINWVKFRFGEEPLVDNLTEF